jgi:hypothetical protein
MIDDRSTLALLVAWIVADDANDALALDDLALGADGFDAGANFHGIGLLSWAGLDLGAKRSI